ncbi:hypothetical protein [Candidatus Symbiopectobacterium sp. NZEC135]|uniref:hypothetical protein n=1 Tax=Candidatus Symbiopectobacterium sp. NZEC135 TaxID=2820471 RepID=UPI0022269393|nr:hypothetical protein [Candidatus Symbiopectobacterium sp. NZEC135]MCW2480162.1 hypothetical protein [Candidatus Symbiopectobacterium sp. NZEC135]
MSITPTIPSGNTPVRMEGSIYFNATGGQSLAAIVSYVNPSEPFENRQIVLTGKYLESSPPILGETVVNFKSLHGFMFIFDIYSTNITSADINIQNGVIQINIWDGQMLHTSIHGEVVTSAGDPFYHSLRSTTSLTVVWGPVN